MTVSASTENILSTALGSRAAASELLAVINSDSVLSDAEIAMLDGAVAGTAAAGKCVVLTTNKVIDTIDITTPKFSGTTVSNVILGTSSGKKVVGGVVTLDGSNPTPVVTGLATVVGAVATIQKSSTPGDDPIVLTVDFGGGVTAGTVNIYAWKTDGTDPTLVASTDNATVVSWIAYGT